MGIIVNEEARKLGLKILGKIFLKFTGSCPTSSNNVATCNLRGFNNFILQFESPAEASMTQNCSSALSVISPNNGIIAIFMIATVYNPETKRVDILEFYTELGKNLDAMHPVASKIAEINMEFTTAANDFFVQNCKEKLLSNF